MNVSIGNHDGIAALAISRTLSEARCWRSNDRIKDEGSLVEINRCDFSPIATQGKVPALLDIVGWRCTLPHGRRYMRRRRILFEEPKSICQTNLNMRRVRT